jgi:hypothetical protein
VFIYNNYVQDSRGVWFDAEVFLAETPMGAEADLTGGAHFDPPAPKVGARPQKRDRTARTAGRRIPWESLLLGGLAAAISLLIGIAMLDVADFGAEFVARPAATEVATIGPVRAPPANPARPAHDAPPPRA